MPISYVSHEHARKLRETICRLKSASAEAVRACAQELQRNATAYPGSACEHAFSPLAEFVALSGLKLHPQSDLLSAFRSFAELLTFLYYRGGDFERAHASLQEHLRGRRQHSPYELACLGFMRGRAAGSSPDEIRSELGAFFGESLADEVARDLADPAEVFAHLVLPHCGECGSCPVAQECFYPQWRRGYASLRSAAAAARIDQLRLRDVFRDKLPSRA